MEGNPNPKTVSYDGSSIEVDVQPCITREICFNLRIINNQDYLILLERFVAENLLLDIVTRIPGKSGINNEQLRLFCFNNILEAGIWYDHAVT
jgi:hypothetical protein